MLVIFCTVPDDEVAQKIARALVTEGLCACVNQIPKVKSYYIYEGEFCEESELLLLIKTDASKFKVVERRIKEIHPYDLPEIVATPISDVSSEYRDWVLASLSFDNA